LLEHPTSEGKRPEPSKETLELRQQLRNKTEELQRVLDQLDEARNNIRVAREHANQAFVVLDRKEAEVDVLKNNLNESVMKEIWSPEVEEFAKEEALADKQLEVALEKVPDIPDKKTLVKTKSKDELADIVENIYSITEEVVQKSRRTCLLSEEYELLKNSIDSALKHDAELIAKINAKKRKTEEDKELVPVLQEHLQLLLDSHKYLQDISSKRNIMLCSVPEMRLLRGMPKPDIEEEMENRLIPIRRNVDISHWRLKTFPGVNKEEPPSLSELWPEIVYDYNVAKQALKAERDKKAEEREGKSE